MKDAYLQNIPFIELQNPSNSTRTTKRRYYADRFYLNRTKEEDDDFNTNVTLFDTPGLIRQLDLMACICSTYTFDASYMSREMPSLFPVNQNGNASVNPKERSNKVPTLVLCGKSLSTGVSKRKKGQNSSLRLPLKRSVSEGENCGYDETNKSWGEHEKVASSSYMPSHQLGSSVHITTISSYYMPRNAPAAPTNDENTSIGPSDHVLRHRKRAQGVFHPKIFVLFERCGSVVVIVTTHNLTPQKTVDGTWCQRFQRKAESDRRRNVNKWSKTMKCDGSDFGWVLADFLHKCGIGASKGNILPEQFLRTYLGFETLNDFRSCFWFEKSEVQLIATVPGIHRGMRCQKHGNGRKNSGTTERTYLYGPQRVCDVLRRQSKLSKPWISPDILSSKDKLLIQTTSLGSKWNAHILSEVLRLYLCENENISVLNRAQIFWPSRRYMESCKEIAADENAAIWHTSIDDLKKEDQIISGHFSFLSSSVFNSLCRSVLSRMVLYRASNPPQIDHYSPHLKLFARTFCFPKTSGGMNPCVDFAWIMLTSACLSQGAQGKTPSYRSAEGTDQDCLVYGNFELGVVFCSRVQDNPTTDRIYSWNPHAIDSTTRIHLPIPFELNPPTYEIDPEESYDFRCDPFFHLIKANDKCHGNMRLTPMGKIDLN